MLGAAFMKLLKKIAKNVWALLKVYSYFFCIMSVGYLFNVRVLGESKDIVLNLSYWIYVFKEGLSVVLPFYFLIETAQQKRNEL